jgi:hypothetical protein
MAGDIPVKGKGRALAARPYQENTTTRLLDGDRNLCAMNQSARNGGDREGVGAPLGVGRGASAASAGASRCRGVSTAAGGSEDGQREDHCKQPCPAAAAWNGEQKHAGQGRTGTGGIPWGFAGWMVLRRSEPGLDELCCSLGGFDDEGGRNPRCRGDVDRGDRERGREGAEIVVDRGKGDRTGESVGWSDGEGYTGGGRAGGYGDASGAWCDGKIFLGG